MRNPNNLPNLQIRPLSPRPPPYNEVEKNTFKEASGEVRGAKVILYSPWNWRLLSDFPDTLTPIFDTNLARNSSHIYRSLLLIEVNHEGIFEMYPWSQAKTLANLKIGIWLDYQVLSSQIENKVNTYSALLPGKWRSQNLASEET